MKIWFQSLTFPNEAKWAAKGYSWTKHKKVWIQNSYECLKSVVNHESRGLGLSIYLRTVWVISFMKFWERNSYVTSEGRKTCSDELMILRCVWGCSNMIKSNSLEDMWQWKKHRSVISHQNAKDRHLSGLKIVNRIQNVQRCSSYTWRGDAHGHSLLQEQVQAVIW